MKKQTQEYRGYRLVQVSDSVVYLYLKCLFVTWTYSVAQAQRVIDEMEHMK